MSAPELGPRLALDRDGRARLDNQLAGRTAGRLTDRDRWLLRMLAEHQMLTSRHVELLAFTGPRQARARLTLLWRLHALDRVRPDLGLRASPAHYGLGPVGAQLLAAQAGTTPADTGWRPDQLLALASSPRRAHHVGTTSLFTALAHQSRTRPPGHGLTTWWPERRCARTWGTWARPDGYGTWTTPTHTLHFFAEYDRGTEPLAKVAAKLTGYTRGSPQTVETTLDDLRLYGSCTGAARLARAGTRLPLALPPGAVEGSGVKGGRRPPRSGRRPLTPEGRPRTMRGAPGPAPGL